MFRHTATIFIPEPPPPPSGLYEYVSCCVYMYVYQVFTGILCVCLPSPQTLTTHISQISPHLPSVWDLLWSPSLLLLFRGIRSVIIIRLTSYGQNSKHQSVFCFPPGLRLTPRHRERAIMPSASSSALSALLVAAAGLFCLTKHANAECDPTL